MDHTPGIPNIILNDSWAAPALGSSVFLVSITLIVLLANPILGSKTVDPVNFIWMSGVSLPVTIAIAIHRIRYVREIFENGVTVQARVVETSHHKSNLRLKLRYTYLTQPEEKIVDQVITGKTKGFLTQKEVTLVIDQRNPGRILLRDAYL